MIPHNLFVSVKLTSLYCGLRFILVYPNPQYRLNRLDEPVFMAVLKPMLTEFGIHYRLESCGSFYFATLEKLAKLQQYYLTIEVNSYWGKRESREHMPKRLLCLRSQEKTTLPWKLLTLAVVLFETESQLSDMMPYAYVLFCVLLTY